MRINFKNIALALALALPLAGSAQTTQPKKPAAKKTTATKTATKPAKKAAPAAEPKAAMPVMTFETKHHNFGQLKTGDKPVFVYNFTNTGTAPLDIDIVSGCDCTELEWTQSSVPPGGKGYIKAAFNTKKAEPEDHKKDLKKYIDIVLKQKNPKNDYPIVASLTFDVFIVD